MKKQKFTIGANALIFNKKSEILLCHRTDIDLWNFPGGAMEPNETPEKTAIREAKEEIGVDIKILKPLGVYTKTKNNDIVFTFLCKIIKGKPSHSDEADAIQYFPVNKLPPNISLLQVERIKDAIQKNKGVIFKKQSKSGY